MNYYDYYLLSPSDRFKTFMKTLSVTNRTPEYYVNWDKVEAKTGEYELELNTLNYLVGKDDVVTKARELFLQQPNLLKAIPSLIASRDKRLDVLIIDEKNDNDMDFYNINFNDIDITKIDTYMDFIKKSGLFNFLKNNIKQNLVDFVYGVEVGLDSNGRKNRSGSTMEDIVAKKVEKTCNYLGYLYKIEATGKWIYENWEIEVPLDKATRRFDAAIYDKFNQKLYLIETNYYGGGGSKLKAVAGEFTSLNRLIKNSSYDISFIWITDGQGWHTTKKAFEDAFMEIDNIFNLDMLRRGFIFSLIK